MQTVKNARESFIPGTSFGIMLPVLQGSRDEICEMLQFVPKTWGERVLPVIEGSSAKGPTGTVYCVAADGDRELIRYIASLLTNAFGEDEVRNPLQETQQKESREVHNVLSGKIFDLKRDAQSVADFCVGYNDVRVEKITLPNRKKPGWVVVAGGKVYQGSGYFA